MKNHIGLLLLSFNVIIHADDYKNGGAEHAAHPEWGYPSQKVKTLKPPHLWGEIQEQCKNGQNQSPIDIRVTEQNYPTDPKLKAPAFHYQQSNMDAFHNRHTVQATNKLDTNFLEYEGKKYILRNIHYHRKSEHLIDGEQFALEIHMVHEGPEGSLLVLGVLIDSEGESTPFGTQLTQLIDKVGPHKDRYEPVKIKLNPSLFLPSNLSYFTYEGSLTTPPCKEGVRWIVFTEKKIIGTKTVEFFRRRQLDVGFSNYRPHFEGVSRYKIHRFIDEKKGAK